MHHYLASKGFDSTLLTLSFASAQAFNSVLPERGLLHWLFSFFFLWTLWNNQFSSFDARRLLRSLVVLFGTAFVLKHMLLASLHAPDGGWLKRVAGALVQGVTLGNFEGTTEDEALENLRDALELHFTPPVATIVPHVRDIEVDIRAA